MTLLFSYKPLVVVLASVFKAVHEAVVPLVVRYSPALPVWSGKASTAAHEVTVPLVVRYLPELPVCEGVYVAANEALEAAAVALEAALDALVEAAEALEAALEA